MKEGVAGSVSPTCHMPCAVLFVAKQGSDSACTWRFILPGMTVRAWRDFALIPCEHAESRLHAAQHREMPLAVNKAAHAQHL